MFLATIFDSITVIVFPVHIRTATSTIDVTTEFIILIRIADNTTMDIKDSVIIGMSVLATAIY